VATAISLEILRPSVGASAHFLAIFWISSKGASKKWRDRWKTPTAEFAVLIKICAIKRLNSNDVEMIAKTDFRPSSAVS
jgi:hypothetical protein